MSELDDVGNFATFGVGRGQHVALLCLGRGRPRPPSNNRIADQSMMHQPLLPVASSTPIAQTDSQPTQVITTEALGNIITDLAKQIGDSITANLSTMHQPSCSQPQSPVSQPSPRHDQSQLRVFVQSETKAPLYFKGDRSDAFSIHEWEDMMRCCLSRMDCKTPTRMFDPMMSRLTGKARDVVKVSQCSHPEWSGAEMLTAVLTLKCNFSELTFSSLPMKDFYSTVPRAGEDAMDYLIHLNKSIDAADECLCRQRKLVEDPSPAHDVWCHVKMSSNKSWRSNTAGCPHIHCKETKSFDFSWNTESVTLRPRTRPP